MANQNEDLSSFNQIPQLPIRISQQRISLMHFTPFIRKSLCRTPTRQFMVKCTK